ncbi:MAG: class I SAM-dependent methyltransferase [Planctomycetes bacterium]|nr:class I SAM-dependent methyltransferase [Planctomycetota bacterium]
MDQAEEFYAGIKPRLLGEVGSQLHLVKHIVDLGCGECDLARFLARNYGQHVTGVDRFSAGFPRTLDLHGAGSVKCVCKDAANLDFIPAESIDAAVTMLALHEMNRPQAVLDEAYRILQPGGIVLVVDWAKGSLAEDLWKEKYFSTSQVRRLLKKSGFQDIHAGLIEKGNVLLAKGLRPR